MTERRFPPPWSVDELEACFVVKDGAGQNLALNRPSYFVSERGAQLSKRGFQAMVGRAARGQLRATVAFCI